MERTEIPAWAAAAVARLVDKCSRCAAAELQAQADALARAAAVLRKGEA